MKLIDLSHTIEDGLVTYKGLPAPIICDYLSREKSKEYYEEGTEFQIGKIEMVSNTGTYIDCPFHRYPEGKDLSQTGLEKFAELDAIVIQFDYHTQGLAIDHTHFSEKDVANKAVLVNTNWDKNWNTDAYFQNHPFLTESAAHYLADQKVKLVGIDSYNIDDTRGKSRPVHTILLSHEILIVEHMTNLNLLPNKGFTFSAVPPKIKGMGTFPVRAFAKV
jgi:arylformamidase